MAHPFVGYGEVPKKLAEAVGLDPRNLTGFTIEVYPDRLVTVRAEYRPVAEGIEQAAQIFAENRAGGAYPAGVRRPFIPVGRLQDLQLRAEAGALTSAERLALTILAGGRDGEEAIPALIDAAQEEYGHGSYRVPVRVVAEKKRLKMILTPPGPIPQQSREGLVRHMIQFLNGDGRVAILPAGFAVTLIEFEPNADGAEVELSTESPTGE